MKYVLCWRESAGGRLCGVIGLGPPSVVDWFVSALMGRDDEAFGRGKRNAGGACASLRANVSHGLLGRVKP